MRLGPGISKTIVALAFSATILLAGALTVRAEQQSQTARAGWPCGARLDPSYFRVAEGSGGHLLLLAPEEIGESAVLLTALGQHPQTIFRLAGSLNPGLHEFHVPIDSSVESVLFSISVQCVQAADVVRPSGALAVGDDVTSLLNFRSGQMVTVKRPEPGTWTLRVAGSGIAAVVVQAQSSLGIAPPEFAPVPGTTFSPLPSARRENVVRIRVNGGGSELHATLVTGEFLQVAELPLSTAEAEATYISRFTPGAQGFRLLLRGTDGNGFPFQRMSAPLLTPTAPDATPK